MDDDALEIQDPDPDGFFRAWSTDAQGNRILVGLTPEETQWYLDFRRKDFRHRLSGNFFPWQSVKDMKEEKSRWLELNNKHELARRQVIGAEIALRDNPTIN